MRSRVACRRGIRPHPDHGRVGPQPGVVFRGRGGFLVHQRLPTNVSFAAAGKKETWQSYVSDLAP